MSIVVLPVVNGWRSWFDLVGARRIVRPAIAL